MSMIMELLHDTLAKCIKIPEFSSFMDNCSLQKTEFISEYEASSNESVDETILQEPNIIFEKQDDYLENINAKLIFNGLRPSILIFCIFFVCFGITQSLDIFSVWWFIDNSIVINSSKSNDSIITNAT